mgnify:CR=1 FL=1
MNIIDYVETNMENFKTLPFNHVDSLVLSQFAYIHFTELVPRIEDDKEPVRIVELLKAENIPKMLEDVRVPKENHRLLVALCMSPRFRNISMCCYSECMSIDEEKQFAAVTYLLDNKKAYIAYRGTDSSFIGWKEDLEFDSNILKVYLGTSPRKFYTKYTYTASELPGYYPIPQHLEFVILRQMELTKE